MTPAERAYNAGVTAALDVARFAADRMRRVPGWKPTREGAADALDAFADAGRALVIVERDPEAPAAVAPVPRPRAPAGGEYVGLSREVVP